MQGAVFAALRSTGALVERCFAICPNDDVVQVITIASRFPGGDRLNALCIVDGVFIGSRSSEIFYRAK